MSKLFFCRHVLGIVLVIGIILPIGNLVVRGQRPETPVQPGQESKPIIVPPTKQTQRAKRIREGTTFKDMYVFFRPGDRTALYTVEDNIRFTCLENLQLERILTIIAEKSGRDYWKIEGIFTEFRGENYVLIRRAQVATPPEVDVPAPPDPGRK